MSPNGHANSIQSNVDPMSPGHGCATHVKSPDRQLSSNNRLKRRRDELETDSNEANDDCRARFSRDVLDSTSREGLSYSPTSARYTLEPERIDDRWNAPSKQEDQRISSIGSNPAHREGRSDQYRPGPKSSPPRSISPPRRPALGSRTTSNIEFPSPRSTHSMHNRRESATHERPRYTNLKWTNPDLQPKRVSNASVTRPSAPTNTSSSPRSPVYLNRDNGHQHDTDWQSKTSSLKSAPTGPKLQRDRMAAIQAAKRKPHIFISRDAVPVNPTIWKHLFKVLAKWIRGDSNINLDEEGWYISFDNTEDGLRRLDECYRARNGKLLFDEYVVAMTRFPNGLQVHEPTSATIKTGRSGSFAEIPNGQTKDVPKETEPVRDSPASPKGVLLTMQPPAKAADPRLGSLASNRATPLTAEIRANGHVPPFRHSSPLRVPSALDKDDSSSSVSGFTGSDSSTSRIPNCHACAKGSDSGILTHCSTCPRRWHNRCHGEPAIPSDLENEHSWQCRRCIKKNVQPKSRLSNSFFTRAASSAPSAGQPDERPAKRQRLEETESLIAPTIQSDAVPAGVHEQVQSDVNEDFGDNASGNQSNGLDGEYVPEDSLVPAPPVGSDELDDLVEKSFSTTTDLSKPGQGPRKPIMLNLTRKKLVTQQENRIADRDDADDTNRSPSGAFNNVPPLDFGTDARPDMSSPSRKRHKWSGGGAEKDIIQAGMSSMFSDASPRRRRGDGLNGRSRDEGAKSAAHDPRPEVPESPEEPRTPTKGKATQPDSEPVASSLHLSPRIKLSLKNTKPSERHNADTLKPQVDPPKRMKPTGVSGVTRCKKCDKRIASNPMGKKLCVDCKNSAAVNAPAALAEEPPEPGPPEVNGINHATPTAAEKIQFSILDLVKSPPSTEEGTSEVSPNRAGNESSQASPAKSGTACSLCRSRRKRCTHRSAPVSSEEDIHAQGEEAGNGGLDSWTAEANDLTKEANQNIEGTIESDGRNESRDASSSLSTAPENPPTATAKVRKRVSQARAATSEFDLGDSYARPLATYEKLIGMALWSAPSNCLSGNEIKRWISENVPGYDHNEGSWEGGVIATLSLRRDGQLDKPNVKPLWRKIGGDGPKRNAPCTYQIIAGNQETKLHWDAVLKQPVSLLTYRDENVRPEGQQKRAEGSNEQDAGLTGNDAGPLTSPTQLPRKRTKPSAIKTPKRPTKDAPKSIYDSPILPVSIPKDVAVEEMDLDELRMADAESSDEEPLAASRRKRSALAKAKAKHDVERPIHSMEKKSGEAISEGITGITPPDSVKTDAKTHSSNMPNLRQPLDQQPEVHGPDWKLVAQLIKEDAENVDCSAKSLFKEWPELDPANKFDAEAKIAEISRRPNRKQKFNPTKNAEPWVRREPYTPQQNGFGAHSSSRSNRVTRSFEEPVFEWEKDPTNNVEYYDSLEKMFDLPENPIPIIQDKQIAYRDGTKFEGTLRRAKKIYMTGYANP